MTSGLVFSLFFVFAYVYIAAAHKKRGLAIWITAVLAIVFSFIFGCFAGWGELASIAGGINFSVLLIFSGILLIAEVLIETGVPGYLAGHIVTRSKNFGHAAIYLCILSSVISVFVENVATVMIVAPIALEVAKKLKANPVVLLIGIAVASNLQGTATLVGDPPSMILAAAENMDFNDFFFMDGKPGIFFAVQIGAIASFFVLSRLLKKDSRPLPKVTIPEVSSWFPAWILAGVIFGLAALSFFFPGVGIEAGLLCISGGGMAVAWHALFRRGHLGNKGKVKHGDRRATDILKNFDWDTLFLLAGIFFMVGALEEMGVMRMVGVFLAGVSGNSPIFAFLIVVVSSVILSAFIDNVPYVTAMIPVTHAIAQTLGEVGQSHYYLTFGLLIGACLGGNISPVGAAANIVSVSVLRKNGFNVSFMDFVKVGLPFTIAATAVGAAFIWFVWGP
ncbi:MAG: anion permease [Candidatus Aegiribacteria sp.]|nr:anion permease [Candidatus Aegiribacteria sp.]